MLSLGQIPGLISLTPGRFRLTYQIRPFPFLLHLLTVNSLIGKSNVQAVSLASLLFTGMQVLDEEHCVLSGIDLHPQTRRFHRTEPGVSDPDRLIGAICRNSLRPGSGPGPRSRRSTQKSPETPTWHSFYLFSSSIIVLDLSYCSTL